MICQRCGTELSQFNRTAFCPGCHLTQALDSANLEPAAPSQASLGTPGQRPSRELSTALSRLSLAIDMASVHVANLKAGSSAWKTQRGVLRGLQEARDIIKASGGF